MWDDLAVPDLSASCAHHGEDGALWRAMNQTPPHSYIDAGAFDPAVESGFSELAIAPYALVVDRATDLTWHTFGLS